jgi:hypothetical protein
MGIAHTLGYDLDGVVVRRRQRLESEERPEALGQWDRARRVQESRFERIQLGSLNGNNHSDYRYRVK